MVTNNKITSLGVVILTTLLVACGGGGGSGTDSVDRLSSATMTCPSASQTTGAKVTISGVITYDRVPHTATGALDYANTTVVPARSIVVNVLGNSGSVLSSAVTDDQGRYSLTVDDYTCVQIQALAQSKNSVDLPANWNFSVADNTNANALYAMVGSLVSSGGESSSRDLHAASGWGGSGYTSARVAAPFAIADTVYTAIKRIIEHYPDTRFPQAYLFWSPNNTTAEGSLVDGEIGTSFFNGGNIYLLGAENSDTDEYDTHLILHEWGHYFENKFSRSDSMGGSHSLVSKLDLRVAFSEGWANAWSAMSQDDPVYTDAIGNRQAIGFTFNMENNSPANRGWFNEASVHSILYDIYDNTNEIGDGVSQPLSDILDVFLSDDYREFSGVTSIYLFIDALLGQQPAIANALNFLKKNQFINGDGGYGEGENNGSGGVPVYYSLTPSTGSITVCSDFDNGEYNRLQNRRLIRLNISTGGIYRITATQISAEAGDSDPDMIVSRQGDDVGVLEGPEVGVETGTLGLSAGEYIVEVYDYNNVDEDDATGGKSCFAVAVTGE